VRKLLLASLLLAGLSGQQAPIKYPVGVYKCPLGHPFDPNVSPQYFVTALGKEGYNNGVYLNKPVFICQTDGLLFILW
jgi:hypothetical protein